MLGVNQLIGFGAGGLMGDHTADTDAYFKASTNPVTSAYTCGATATLLVLSLITKDTPRTGGAPTYNSVAMLQAGSTQDSGGSSIAEIWYLPDPTVGSPETISVPNNGTDSVSVEASSWISSTGKSELDVADGGTGNSTTPSQAVITTVNGAVIIDSCGHNNSSIPSANNQTLLSSVDEGAYSSNAQYALQAVAGSITFTYTAGNNSWCIAVVAFKVV